MTDLPTLAAALLGNFATVRIPRRERLRSCSDPDPSLGATSNRGTIALPVNAHLVADCHRRYLRQRLLDDGHRAFFDRIEGGGPDGWRLHFFCLDQSAVILLCAVGVGECGPGNPANFNAEEFVARRRRQLERSGRRDKPDDWWWGCD